MTDTVDLSKLKTPPPPPPSNLKTELRIARLPKETAAAVVEVLADCEGFGYKAAADRLSSAGFTIDAGTVKGWRQRNKVADGID